MLRQEYRALEAELELYAPRVAAAGPARKPSYRPRPILKVHIRHIEHEQQHLRHRPWSSSNMGQELQAELKPARVTVSAQLAYDDRGPCPGSGAGRPVSAGPTLSTMS